MSEASEGSTGDALSVEDALHAYTDHISEALGKHKDRAITARQASAASELKAADVQQHLLDFTMQVWTDSLRSVSHATKLARAVADEQR